MATPSETLRLDIQAAGPGDTITLDPNDSPFSVVTLAKIECSTPITGAAGYTIDGAGSTINDTRIYQNNIDGPAPGTVTNLTLDYLSAAANKTAILRASQGTYDLTNVNITGNHSGWAGNGGVYMSLNSQTPNNVASPPSTAELNLTNVNVSVKGQTGFTPTSGGTAFLQSWNNSAGVNITGSTFDEAGFRNSFHFATFSGTSSPPATLLGEYNITDSTFTRSSNSTVRSRGNVLESVKATFDGTNTFENGSFLDISGNVNQITFAPGSQINFNNIPADGYGIRVSETSPSGQSLLGTAVTAGAMFEFIGSGLPLKYVNSADGSFTTLPAGIGTQYNINGQTVSGLIAGGQGNDTINGNNTSDWINGDSGNDFIDGKSGADILLGGLGNDTIIGGAGNDTLNGGDGIDTISFAGGTGVTVNLAAGTATGQGIDTFSNFENLIGTNSADTLTGDANANYIDGGASGDTIDGGAGDDTIDGGAGADSIIGGTGNDSLNGGTGNSIDTINGGIGNDTIIGGQGNDLLTGGAGIDTFAYTATSPAEGNDTITDFLAGTDFLAFSKIPFGNLPFGTLNAANFQSGAGLTQATTPANTPTFVFNTTTSQLIYDLNGGTAGGTSNIAILTGVTSLSNTNITIF